MKVALLFWISGLLLFIVFTNIHIHLLFKGERIKESLMKRVIELSAEKYCSASIMLERGGVNIAHGYEILEAHSG